HRTTARQFRTRVLRVRSAVGSFRNSGFARPDLEILAIVQHYKKELGVPTWLLDVTTSPYIGLFFASDGGEETEIGAIDYIERTEWMSFGGERSDAVGTIRYISPHGIPRIENQ